MDHATHILACISPSPSNERIITNAADMAKAYNCLFSALYVEASSSLSVEDKKQLHKNMTLARQLGAKVETVIGNDIPYQIAEFARLNNVTTLVIGRSGPKHIFSTSSLTDKVTDLAPFLDIHIIPDAYGNISYQSRIIPQEKINIKPSDIFISIGVLALSTLLGYLFFITVPAEANIIMIYILGVLIDAVLTTHQIYPLSLSIINVFVYNYLFTSPRFTLQVYDPSTPVTFLVMIITAFITSSLAIRLKENARNSALAAYRTKILFDTNQQLEKAQARDEILSLTASQVQKLLNRTVILFPAKNGTLTNPSFYFLPNTGYQFVLEEKSYEAAEWTYRNNKQSGYGTNQFGDLNILFLSIRLLDSTFGVLGIVLNNEPLAQYEQSILLSILGECALALENEQNRRIREEETLHAKNEQLRANLLRSISHDLRTPLTSISGNASLLLEETIADPERKTIINDIIDDSRWLITLVENLLYVTRIEDGRMNLSPSNELLSEIIDEALRHVSRKKADHHIIVEHDDDLLLVYADTKLLVQVFINLIDNAIKYTQSGSTIRIKTRKENNIAYITVSDNGPGIKEKDRIFDLFYTGSNHIADARRSMGMGLSLCKSILKAHGQDIIVMDNNPIGTIFEFTLPCKEVIIHE